MGRIHKALWLKDFEPFLRCNSNIWNTDILLSWNFSWWNWETYILKKSSTKIVTFILVKAFIILDMSTDGNLNSTKVLNWEIKNRCLRKKLKITISSWLHNFWQFYKSEDRFWFHTVQPKWETESSYGLLVRPP